MSVLRRVNWISQQRVEVPDMRSVESAASNDFDGLIQTFVTGTTQGYILRGFAISMSGAIAGASNGLQVVVDPGAVFHVSSSQSGTFYLVPTGTTPQQLNSATNTIVDGSFSPSAVNYVGLEYERFIDPTTTSQVYLWDPTTKDETTLSAPRAQILRYRFKITTSSWASNVLPIATVTTDSGNNVVSITDSRSMLFRLGQGGATPNPFFQYPWTAQSEGRTENPPTSSNNNVDPFEGGDKMLFTLKDWMDAIMTSLQEIKGTTYWYSNSSAGSINSLREDLGNTVITGRGHISHSATTAGLINWDQDINIRVIGSNLTYTLLANPSSTDVTLTDDQVAYVTLIRNVITGPNVIFTNGSAVVQSVGSISWTGALLAGDWLKLGSDTDQNYYKILSVDSLTQVTLTSAYTGASTGAAGAKGAYAFGTYQNAPTPSTSRNVFIASRKQVPQNQDVFWLLMRSDNAGSTPKVYVRFLGADLDQGVSEEISDNKSDETLQYIGAPLTSSFSPMYVSALNPGSVPQITSISTGAASTITAGQYFFINSSANAREYYIWFKKDGAGTDPAPGGASAALLVNITTGQTSAQVAAAITAVFNNAPIDDFTAVQQPTPNTNVVRVTNNSSGTSNAAVNFNVGAPFTVTTIQSGTGTGNSFINDGDNLTLAIKKLDQAVATLEALLNGSAYDELISIVASGATPPTSLNGPISSGTILLLPNNSRAAGAPERYIVGNGALEVFLNGQYLILGHDWAEVGSTSSLSDQIQILQGLVVGDTLELRVQSAGGGSGSGGGGTGPAGPTGPQGPPGNDAAGGPISIGTKTSNYTVLNTDCFLRADCTLSNITFTLPPAASVTGRIFYIKKIDVTANTLMIAANGAETIDGSNTQTLTSQYQSISIISNGTSWDAF